MNEDYKLKSNIVIGTMGGLGDQLAPDRFIKLVEKLKYFSLEDIFNCYPTINLIVIKKLI